MYGFLISNIFFIFRDYRLTFGTCISILFMFIYYYCFFY